MRKTKVFSGSAYPELCSQIVDRLAMHASQVSVSMYANHEMALHLGASVRGDDVFLVQSGSDSMNDHLMELLIMINAARISSARRITAVIPYFPYGKWSKKKKQRGSITAKLVANMLAVAGVDHVITMDLHSSEIQGFFALPVDNLRALPSLAKFIVDKVADYSTGVVVAKNANAVKRVTSLADRLNIEFGLIHRELIPPALVPQIITMLKPPENTMMMSSSSSVDSLMSVDKQHPFVRGISRVLDDQEEEEILDDDDDEVANSPNELTLLGNVKGKVVFVMDDIIDSTKTFLEAARHLINKSGASKVYLVATHAILSGDALTEIENCSQVHGLIVTNSYPIPEAKRKLSNKLHVVDISGVLSEAIRRTRNGESISYLFEAAVV